MRIGFLAQENMAVPPPVPGGSVARVVHQLAHELAAMDGRFEVTVCSLPHPEIPPGTHDNVRYVRVDPGGDARRHALYSEAIRVLRRLDLPHRELQGMPLYSHSYASAGLRRLAAYDPDVVHLQNVSQFLPLARHILPRAKLVLHMHCDWLRQLPPRTARKRLAHADLVLAVSDYISHRIRDGFPELTSRCRTLHNGTDIDVARPHEELARPLRRLTSEVRLRHGLRDGPVALYVGGFAPEKGIDVLIEAWRTVLDEFPRATLLLVGAYNRYFQVRAPRGRRTRAELRRRQRAYRALLPALAAPFGDRVVFLGGVPHHELPAYYAAADVYTMPSTGAEPFSLTIPEAMAARLPVVATATGGTPEIVADGVNGLLVGPRDPVALAGAFLRLFREPEIGYELGAHGLALVRHRFTWRAQAQRLGAYYEEAAGVCGLDLRPPSFALSSI